MAKKITDPNAIPDPNSPAQVEVEEVLPHRGGSYVRNEDGTLTQTEGHDVVETKQE